MAESPFQTISEVKNKSVISPSPLRPDYNHLFTKALNKILVI
jgi:hypothetical protein